MFLTLLLSFISARFLIYWARLLRAVFSSIPLSSTMPIMLAASQNTAHENVTILRPTVARESPKIPSPFHPVGAIDLSIFLT
jgi:hypothetical protein